MLRFVFEVLRFVAEQFSTNHPFHTQVYMTPVHRVTVEASNRFSIASAKGSSENLLEAVLRAERCETRPQGASLKSE